MLADILPKIKSRPQTKFDDRVSSTCMQRRTDGRLKPLYVKKIIFVYVFFYLNSISIDEINIFRKGTTLIFTDFY